MSQSADRNSAVYPYLAPLSSTLIQHSFNQRYQNDYTVPPLVFSSEQAAHLAQEQFKRIWNGYLSDFRTARQRIVEEIDGVVLLDKQRPVRKKELSPTWFREQLSRIGPQEKGYRLISTDAIDAFSKSGVLRKSSWGVYEPESMVALLLCRQLNQKRERHWLPTALEDKEEWYWVWTQEKPDAALRPCPYPDLPAWLSPSTLVFTRWAGASWSNVGWIRIGNLGAISFAGLLQQSQHMPSISTLEELPITLMPQQFEQWNYPQKAVESTDLMRGRNAHIEMGTDLSDTLEILARFKSTGTLCATVKRSRREMVQTVELFNGKVVSCKSQGIDHAVPTSIKLSELLRAEAKQPCAWIFQAHSSDVSAHISNFNSVRQPESQVEIRALIIKTLRHLAVPLFSASNLGMI